MKITILDMSKPVKGLIYSPHIVEKAIAKANWTVPVIWEGATTISNNTLIGFASGLCVEGKSLTATVSLYNNSNSHLLRQLIENGNDLSFASIGTSTTTLDVNNNKIVNDDYEILAVTIDVKKQNNPQTENE